MRGGCLAFAARRSSGLGMCVWVRVGVVCVWVVVGVCKWGWVCVCGWVSVWCVCVGWRAGVYRCGRVCVQWVWCGVCLCG